MTSKKIVLSGGPGTGKTTLIRALEASGHKCIHEIIRTMTLQAKKAGAPGTLISNPLAFVSDPVAFNKKLLEGRVRDFHNAPGSEGGLIFYDRGIPDILAYMDYFSQPYDGSFIAACKKYRYDGVALFPPWEAIYEADNERLESFEEAMRIYRCLVNTYTTFGYAPVIVPKGTVESRRLFIEHNFNTA